MKFFNRQNSDKTRKPVEPETDLYREPEGYVHPDYRHWVYLGRSSDR